MFLTLALESVSPNGPAKPRPVTVSLPAGVRISAECASPLTPDDAPIIAAARTHARDNDRSHHLYVRALLRSLLFTQHPIAPRFLHPASPLDFRKGEAETHSNSKLFN